MAEREVIGVVFIMMGGGGKPITAGVFYPDPFNNTEVVQDKDENRGLAFPLL